MAFFQRKEKGHGIGKTKRKVEGCLRSGDYRVCHFGRRARGHRHFGYHGVSAQDPRTLGRYFGGDHGALSDQRGQGTVEYALVMAAFAAMIFALGCLWRQMETGLFIQHALASASHSIQASVGWVVDVFGF